MCGRYATNLDPETLYGIFDAQPDPAVDPGAPGPDAAGPGTGAYGGDVPRRPRFNIAPTTDNPVVRVRPSSAGDVRRIDHLHWGLVPSWAQDPAVGNKLFNARAETVADKPAFRRALAARRCLVPASGFYEWRKLDAQPATGSAAGRAAAKQPFYIRPADGSVLAFAGLWEYWKPRAEPAAEPGAAPAADPPEPLVSYTILTTAAVGRMAEIHSRMPLILPAPAWDAWLDPHRSADEVAELLQPPSVELVEQLEFRPVGPEVGNVRNDGPELLRPFEMLSADVPLRHQGDGADQQLALPL